MLSGQKFQFVGFLLLNTGLPIISFERKSDGEREHDAAQLPVQRPPRYCEFAATYDSERRGLVRLPASPWSPAEDTSSRVLRRRLHLSPQKLSWALWPTRDISFRCRDTTTQSFCVPCSCMALLHGSTGTKFVSTCSAQVRCTHFCCGESSTPQLGNAKHERKDDYHSPLSSIKLGCTSFHHLRLAIGVP